MSSSPQAIQARPARDIPLALRVAAYISVLLGYIFYCYNYIVVGYVRPYLVSQVGFSVADTALISMAGNIGVTIGAVAWASVIARAGRRKTVIMIAAGIGTLAIIQASTRILGIWIGSRLLMDAMLGGYYVVATSLVVALFPAQSRAKLIALNSAMYPGANMLIGILGGLFGDTHWWILLWLAAAPLPIAVLLYFTIPPDRTYHAYDDATAAQQAEKGRWSDMFSPRLRWLMVGCVVLSGLDFNAYQLFSGFMTLYIKNSLNMSAVAMGAIVAFTSAGSFLGNFFWAVIADKYGRRAPLVGYVLAAAMVLVFVSPGLDQTTLSIIGFIFGLGMSCTTAWGAWFAELFPPRLRAHGAALFHVGHILALGSPLLAAYMAKELGLPTAMSVAAIVYVAGAALWFILPETQPRRARQARVADMKPPIEPLRNET